MATLQGKYFVKNKENGEYQDITTLFDGCKILSISGFDEQGKPLNIHTEQWLLPDSEGKQMDDDYIIANDEGVVLRENIDIEITFIVGNKYATQLIDVRKQHDAFIAYMTNSKIWVKSMYEEKEVPCASLDSYKPTITKLQRGLQSFMMGTLKLHTLNTPKNISEEPVVGDLYIGFGDDALTSVSEILNLLNVQHYNKQDASGDYTIVCPTLSYLWICTKGTISKVTANGFEVPMNSVTNVGDYRCYRSANDIKPHTMSFTIITN